MVFNGRAIKERLPSEGAVAWFLWGAMATIATCLIWSGGKGAFALLAVAGLGGAALLHAGVGPRAPFAPLAGLLAGLDVFAIWLWVSPPCQLDTLRFEETAGELEFFCDPQTGMASLAIRAIVASFVLGAVLWWWARYRSRRGAPVTGTRRRSGLEVPAWCALLALLAAAAVAIPVLKTNDWSPSALVRMAEEEPTAELARDIDPDFRLFHSESHYDGVYFYTIALDPLARGEAHRTIDLGEHRYTHPLYGWLAWIVTAGQPSLVPLALLVIGVLSMAAAAFGFSLLARSLGLSAWWGLVVPLNPGLLASVSFDTAEPLVAALLGFGLFAWFRGRTLQGALLLLLLCFARQPLAIVPIALGVTEVVKMARGSTAARAWSRVALLAVGPAAMALWQVYLHSRFGVWSFETAEVVLTIPFEGWVEAFRIAATLGGLEGAQIGLASLPILVAALSFALLATSAALRFRSPLAPVYLGLVFIYLSLGEFGLVFPKDLLRFSTIPWLVAPLLLVPPRPEAPTDHPFGRRT